MRKLLTLQYDGSKFSGYATQLHRNTVQDTLQKVLKEIFNDEIKTISASRTDKGVHAIAQKVAIDISFEIENLRLKKALNCLLPNSIVVVNVLSVEDNFHPRYDVKYKVYDYILTTKLNAFNGPYKTLLKKEVDIELIKQGINVLIGKHDYSAFCAANSGAVEKIRTIYKIDLEQKEDDLIFKFYGDGFLYNMIRIIVGTLIEVGTKNITIEELKKILKGLDRKKSGSTYPPNGLYLKEINYCDIIL